MDFPHGLLFHHFWDNSHPRGQGAISGDEFELILKHVGLENLLRAEDWLKRARSNTLRETDICITFDDGLRCQFDVALPVLEKHNLTAFWFIYTAPIVGEFDELEIFRYFRTSCFENISDFYNAFDLFIAESDFSQSVSAQVRDADIDKYLPHAPFYSYRDRRFRFIRNEILGPERYARVMNDIMRHRQFDREAVAGNLWLSKEQIGVLDSKDHVIGLHSHSHPTSLEKQDRKTQRNEFQTNKSILENVTGGTITSASYPCNSYSDITLDVLRDLGISVAFRADTSRKRDPYLELPRINHALILERMIDEEPADQIGPH